MKVQGGLSEKVKGDYIKKPDKGSCQTEGNFWHYIILPPKQL